MTQFDLLIVTARDGEQQWLFQQRLAALPLEGLARRVLVVADPPGPQPGSGGSTLYALCAALDALGIPFPVGAGAEGELARRLEGWRLLLVHCGGFSQRVPQFASLGKAFAPAGGEGQSQTLLEGVVESLAGLTSGLPPGALIACGDVIYRAGPVSLPAGTDAAAWAWPASLHLASRHGVYLWEALTGEVTGTLQKASQERLREAGFSDTAPLDTGVLYLSPAVLAALLAPMAGTDMGPTPRHRSGRAPERAAVRQALRSAELWTGLDLYRDVTRALSREGKREAGAAHPLLRRLARFRLRALCPEDGEFLHYGSTPELLAALQQGSSSGPALINSIIEGEGAQIAPGAVLHHCALSGPVRVGEGAFCMGLRAGGIELADHRVAYQLPVRAGAAGREPGRDALVVLDIGDDPKAGVEAILMGEPLRDWSEARGLCEEALWSGIPRGARALWNARIFPVGSPAELARAGNWLQAGEPRLVPGNIRLLSMEEIHRGFHARRWWRYECRLRARVLAAELRERLDGDPETSLATLTRSIPCTLVPTVLGELERLARRDRAPLHAARLWRVCAELAGARDLDSPFHARAFRCIERGVSIAVGRTEPRAWIVPPGFEVAARAPARVDLAGGWTDTPPQALEWGGAVVNAALLLNGEYPIRVRTRVVSEPVLRFEACDLEQTLEVSGLDILDRHGDPADPFALHKAAFVEAGLRRRGARSLEAMLHGLGGGLLLQTEARVPKGSGLGTSSILGAAVLGCLRRLTGQDTSWRALFSAVLRLEQRMTTGGGWQDQMGGMLPGLKLTETSPGSDPTPRVKPLALPPGIREELEARLVLFYTGVPRLARNVLQRVIDRYLAREPEALAVLRRMPELARELAGALEAGDLEAAGRGLSESWELNRRLEPSASNPEIERLFEMTATYCVGAKLAGAGGGGFMVLLARSAEDARRLRRLLPELQPSGRLHEAVLAPRGLQLETWGGDAE